MRDVKGARTAENPKRACSVRVHIAVATGGAGACHHCSPSMACHLNSPSVLQYVARRFCYVPETIVRVCVCVMESTHEVSNNPCHLATPAGLLLTKHSRGQRHTRLRRLDTSMPAELTSMVRHQVMAWLVVSKPAGGSNSINVNNKVTET